MKYKVILSEQTLNVLADLVSKNVWNHNRGTCNYKECAICDEINAEDETLRAINAAEPVA